MDRPARQRSTARIKGLIPHRWARRGRNSEGTIPSSPAPSHQQTPVSAPSPRSSAPLSNNPSACTPSPLRRTDPVHRRCDTAAFPITPLSEPDLPCGPRSLPDDSVRPHKVNPVPAYSSSSDYSSVSNGASEHNLSALSLSPVAASDVSPSSNRTPVTTPKTAPRRPPPAISVPDEADCAYDGQADRESDLDSDDLSAAHRADSLPDDAARLPSFEDPRTTPRVAPLIVGEGDEEPQENSERPRTVTFDDGDLSVSDSDERGAGEDDEDEDEIVLAGPKSAPERLRVQTRQRSFQPKSFDRSRAMHDVLNGLNYLTDDGEDEDEIGGGASSSRVDEATKRRARRTARRRRLLQRLSPNPKARFVSGGFGLSVGGGGGGTPMAGTPSSGGGSGGPNSARARALTPADGFYETRVPKGEVFAALRRILERDCQGLIEFERDESEICARVPVAQDATYQLIHIIGVVQETDGVTRVRLRKSFVDRFRVSSEEFGYFVANIILRLQRGEGGKPCPPLLEVREVV